MERDRISSVFQEYPSDSCVKDGLEREDRGSRESQQQALIWDQPKSKLLRSDLVEAVRRAKRRGHMPKTVSCGKNTIRRHVILPMHEVKPQFICVN